VAIVENREKSLGMVAHACKFQHSGRGRRRILSLRPVWGRYLDPVGKEREKKKKRKKGRGRGEEEGEEEGEGRRKGRKKTEKSNNNKQWLELLLWARHDFGYII
jgi:hypothetical protein